MNILISKEAVQNAIYEMHAGGKEAVENALRNTYGADLREIIYEIDPLPTMDMDALRDEIEKIGVVGVTDYPLIPKEKVMQVIKKYTKKTA